MSCSEQEAVLQAALGYLDLGWSVIPIRRTGKWKGPFAPLLPRSRVTGRGSWKLLAETPTSAEQVRGWFASEPSINIAIATGYCSRLAVVDFDVPPPPCVMRLLEDLGAAIVRTKRGIHAYFWITEPTKSQTFAAQNFLFELKADGCYVIAPPSIHPSGRDYAWKVEPNGNLPPLSDFYDGLSRCGFTLKEASPPPPGAAVVRPAGDCAKTIAVSAEAMALLDAMPATVKERADWFREIARNVELSVAFVSSMSFTTASIGTGFLCPLHPETHASAALWQGRNGEIVFHDFHLQGTEVEYLTLPELRYSMAITTPTKLKPTSMPFWRLLGIHEARLLPLAPVRLPAFPPDLGEDALKVYKALGTALGIHWLMEPGKEFAFGVTLAVALTGLPRNRAHTAITVLCERDIIRVVGTCRSGFPNPTRLYLPGDGR